MRRPVSAGAPHPTAFLLILIAVALLSSCELLFMDPEPNTSPASIFEQVWTFVDREYSFFELKEVDWDATGDIYRPQVRPDMTDAELFDLLAEMLFVLEDGHVNLKSSFDFSRNWTWFLDYPQNFDYALLERNYFNGQQQYVGPFVTVELGDVVYSRYGSFSSSFTEDQLDYLFTEFAGSTGFILDVRDNGGGSLWNAYRIANRLVTEATEIGHQVYKNGPAHDQFTNPERVIIAPPAGAALWEKPFVILTNRSSYSATNMLVALTTYLPNVTVIGDATGGGGGIPAFTELSNGWLLRVSAHRLFADVPYKAERLNVELGIEPDIWVDMDGAADVDAILESALTYIGDL